MRVLMGFMIPILVFFYMGLLRLFIYTFYFNRDLNTKKCQVVTHMNLSLISNILVVKSPFICKAGA